MFKTLLGATALLAVTVSPAFAKDGARTFTRGGETFTYVTAVKAGRVLLSGHSLTTGSTFNLQVRGDHVSGVSGGVPVAFDMPGAQAKLSGVQVAAR